MDLRSFNASYLRQNGMTPINIHKSIEAALDIDATDYSRVRKWRGEAQFSYDSESTQTSIEDEDQGLIDKAVLLATAEKPFCLRFPKGLEGADSKNNNLPSLDYPARHDSEASSLGSLQTATPAERQSSPKSSRVSGCPEVSETLFLEEHYYP
jgi:hypothetical protein